MLPLSSRTAATVRVSSSMPSYLPFRAGSSAGRNSPSSLCRFHHSCHGAGSSKQGAGVSSRRLATMCRRARGSCSFASAAIRAPIARRSRYPARACAAARRTRGSGSRLSASPSKVALHSRGSRRAAQATAARTRGRSCLRSAGRSELKMASSPARRTICRTAPQRVRQSSASACLKTASRFAAGPGSVAAAAEAVSSRQQSLNLVRGRMALVVTRSAGAAPPFSPGERFGTK